jgi:phage gp36-like protein
MYCTLDDLKAQAPEQVLVHLSDDEGIGQINQARVDAAIAAATDEINGYCQARYPVPFEPVPGFIRKLAADIALYNLFARRGYDEESADKAVVDRYRAAVRTLENIARGLVTLGAPEPAPAAEGLDVRSRERVFSREKLEGF